MAANMDTKMVKEIMTEFETQENGTKVPSKVLDAVHEVITGKNDIVQVLMLKSNKNLNLKASFMCPHSTHCSNPKKVLNENVTPQFLYTQYLL